ncbi:MAG: flagellar biosynthetic protein FliO [Candidatus Rokubacteria bacterium]|nr:flagellar biosynthetic protein FliO [Candidatus Rokubacteria bacterium]
MGWIAARLFSSLLLVGGLLAGGLFVYRRWVGRGVLARRSDLIRVVSRSYLGPKESLCLVRVGKEHLLVGVTGSQISFLHRWEAGAVIEPPHGESGFARQFEASASRLRLTDLESSIRGHILSLKGHLASLGRPSKGIRDA